MSLKNRINKIVSRNTHLSDKAIDAGRILANYYACDGNDEFAIDFLDHLGRAVENHASLPVASADYNETAVRYVESSLGPDYLAELGYSGLTEGRILVYALDCVLTLHEKLADPEKSLVILAAIIDVAMRVNLRNADTDEPVLKKSSINKAVSVAAMTGYKKCLENPDVDSYHIAVEAMEILDGDVGDYGLVPSLVDTLYANLCGKPDFGDITQLFRLTVDEHEDDEGERKPAACVVHAPELTVQPEQPSVFVLESVGTTEPEPDDDNPFAEMLSELEAQDKPLAVIVEEEDPLDGILDGLSL